MRIAPARRTSTPYAARVSGSSAPSALRCHAATTRRSRSSTPSLAGRGCFWHGRTGAPDPAAPLGPGLAHGCGQARRQLGLDHAQGLSAQLVVRPPDLGHPRLEVAGQDRAGDPAEIDAEILVGGTIGNGDVGGDADQQFVDDQSLGPERDEFLGLEAGERAALVRLVEAGERVLGAEDRRERQQDRRQLRSDPRIPGAVAPSSSALSGPDGPAVALGMRSGPI